MESGIIKKWNDPQKWGIIYCPGGRKFFLHSRSVVSGTPQLYSRVKFEVGVPRNQFELPPAVNVTVGEIVTPVAPRSLEVR